MYPKSNTKPTRGVVNIDDLLQYNPWKLSDAEEIFRGKRPDHRFAHSIGSSATYLFETVEGAIVFSQILDSMGVASSCRSVNDNDGVASEKFAHLEKELGYFGSIQRFN